MCLYTPQGTKKKVRGSSSGTKSISASSLPRTGGRHAMPRGAQIILNQPAPIPPPTMYPQYAQQPRIEVIGEGETTNIYLPSPAPTQNGQFQGQGTNNNSNQQNGGQNRQTGQNNGQQQGQGQERGRSSGIVQEVEGVMRLAKRVGDAVRRGSASSFGRGRDYYREEQERRRERERERELERERGRLLERHRRRRRHRRGSSTSTERSRSRERRREVIEVKHSNQLKIVDEEARQMARYAGSMAESLVRERDMKKKVKRLAEKKREEEERKEQKLEERLADRVLSRYGSGGLLGPPPPPRGRRLLAGGDEWRDRNGGSDWRDNVSWAPWNANAYNQNYAVGPPAPPAQPPAQAYANNSSGENSNNNSNSSGNSGGNGGRDDNRRRRSRSASRERTTGSNHIHVHTAPLVQGPQISTSTPTGASSGAYGEMPGMSAASNSAARMMGGRRSSWVEPLRHVQGQVQGAIQAAMGGGYRGLGLGMPGVQTQFVSGVTPIHAMNGMGMGMGMGGMGVPVANAVPIGEREWQRARVYSSHAPDNGMGGMMY